MRYNIDDFRFNGTYHKQFWDKTYNPNADLDNALANCTTMVYGLCLVEKNPVPITRIVSASRWDEVLANDWECVEFDTSKVKAGDIIQWKSKGHVAKVANISDGVIYINGSYYTGEHGVAYYDGGYDTRNFSSLQELSDFMYNNYPDRLYHYWSLDKESQIVGGEPDNILVLPNTLSPVDPNNEVDQVETTDNQLRIRDNPSLDSNIIGHVSIGYYNVLQIKDASDEDKAKEPDLKCWYEIAKNRWIANVTTIYHEKSEDVDILEELERFVNITRSKIKALEGENKQMKEDYALIAKIAEKWV